MTAVAVPEVWDDAAWEAMYDPDDDRPKTAVIDTGLRVPAVSTDDSVLTAALAYAAAGFYVGPLAAGTKHPGSVLGASWQRKTSRDPKVIASWFAGTTYGIFLHAGRSGVVVVDVDDPDQLHPDIGQAVDELHPPFQATRPDEPGRGHYVFQVPPGRRFGNALGTLTGGWGDIRGQNGVIVVSPTEHPSGGLYEWVQTGPVPVLPGCLVDQLPDALDAAATVSDAEVERFFAAHDTVVTPPYVPGPDALLGAHLGGIKKKLAVGESRHQTFCGPVAGAMKDACAGLLDAKLAADTMEAAFVDAVTQPPATPRQGPARSVSAARSEFLGILAWAVAQAMASDPTQTVVRVKDMFALTTPEGGTVEKVGVPVAAEVRGRRPDPGRYVGRDGLKATTLYDDVLDMGPLVAGVDGRVWAYEDGVYRPGQRALEARVVWLTGERFRTAYTATIAAMILAQHPFITDEPDTRFINVTNGLLEWSTGELLPHTPDVPTTTQIPVAWQPDARCPAVDAFLRDVVPEDVVPLLEEIAGYAMFNDQPLHKAVMLVGSGRNGKGVFLRLLVRLLGHNNIAATAPQKLDTDRWAPATLFGKLANIVGDVDPRTFKETATFKQATGQDLLHGEYKYAQPFTFTSRAVIVAAFNSLPRSFDTTEGFFSRWVVVAFPHQFADPDTSGRVPRGCRRKDPDLFAKITTVGEVEGFLVRAVEGLRRVKAAGRFSRPGAVAAAELEFRRHADPVRGYLAEQVVADPTGWVTRGQLHVGYRQWADDNGLRPLPARQFVEKVREVHLETFGFAPTETKRQGYRGWAGLRSRSDDDDDDDDGQGAKGALVALIPIPTPTYEGKGGTSAPSAPSAPSTEDAPP